MVRRILSYLVNVLIVAALVLPIAYVSLFRTVTGHWFPKWEVETLSNPVAVKGWTTEGLLLADGRLLRLAGVSALPNESAALSEATKRGVEVGAEGRIYGLVKLRRTCGNDPVVQRVVRVDLADMLVYLQEAAPTRSLSAEQANWPRTARAEFTQRGWSVGDLGSFMEWQYEGRLTTDNQ